MRRFLLSFFLLLWSLNTFAQGESKPSAIVKGKVLSANTQNSLGDLEVVIPALKLLTTTDGNGEFNFSQVAYGSYVVIISNGYSVHDTLKVSVDQNLVDLGTLTVAIDDAATNPTSGQLPTIALEESSSSADDDGISDQSISGVLTASRDPFLSAAAFTFGPMRYQLRGYNRDQLEVYLNGLQMNDVEMGSAFYGQWGGLNDVFRNQSVVFGLQPGEDGFGGLTGSSSMNVTAATQRKQTRVSYSLSNRTYRNRLMVTHSTGMMQNGWAFSVSASRRWAQEGYIPGTSYDGYSYYVGVSKKLGQKSLLSFTTFGAPTKRGKAAPATQEAMDLAGTHYYNPNWGYQDGEKRNSRINNSFQPVYMLNYEYNPNSSTHLNIVAAYQNGFNGNSALDWYNARDPRPDYYRNLPSSYLLDPAGSDPVTAAAVKQEWLTNPAVGQIDWQRMYDANRSNHDVVNGVSGNRSLYVVGEDRDDIKKYSFAANLQKALNEHITFYAGVSFISQQTESYRKLLDLLGGDYYVNLNQFAERTYIGNATFNQNDLNNPNGIVRVGDKYSYDYIARFRKSFAWAQGVFTYNKIDFFLAGRVGEDAFSREGLFRNGLFANDSYGKSETQSFLNYQVKGGLTYKINGRNYLFVNGSLMTNPPVFDNTFFSPRTRNNMIPDPKVEHIKSIEGGYLLRSPSFSGRLTAFATDVNDATDIMRFYHEDYRTFVNYVMQGVNIRHIGGELAVQAKISPSFSATAVATWAQVFYTSRPTINIYQDNDTSSTVGQSISYLKNYYVASGPQSAYTLGLNYRSPKYWYASINCNLMDRNYVEVNPSRLSASAVDLLAPGSPEWKGILDQEKLPAAFTVDLSAGKSFLVNKWKALHWMPRGTTLFLNAGVSNLLNNKNVQTGGFEQLRFDYTSNNPERFPSKYFYGYGANFFVNVSLKF